jgi:hypothetical protein
VTVDTTSGDPKRICLNPSANRVGVVLENFLYPNVLTSRGKQAAAAHIFLLSLRRRLLVICCPLLGRNMAVTVLVESGEGGLWRL